MAAAGRVLSISRFNPDLILAEKGKAKTVDCLNSSRIPHLYLSQLVSPFSADGSRPLSFRLGNALTVHIELLNECRPGSLTTQEAFTIRQSHPLYTMNLALVFL
jgi:hypothetical protein